MSKCAALLVILLLHTILCQAEFSERWPDLAKITPPSAPIVQSSTVQELIQRIFPKRQHEFKIVVDPLLATTGRDTFQLTKKRGDAIVRISGSSGVAAAAGLNHYLKYFCKCQYSWETYSQLNLPDELPLVDTQIVSLDKFRYYQNVCTLGYSFVWWGWSQWEKHLDWMALNGINLPLAFLGQEAIWLKVWRNLGLNQLEIDQHFTGPAFLPWGRMGNMRGWGGPLPTSWHSKSLELQHQVLERMRAFGMTPVLPAFAGFVPRAFTRIYPTANVTKTAQWNHFDDQYCCPYMLQPEDPLFQKIGSLFLREMIAEFGTDHIYNCDTFNEMDPKSGDIKYIESVGYATYSAMTAVDPDAIWMLQGWLFIHGEFWTKERARALLTSIPQGRMLVLDLQSELSEQFTRLDSYFGQPFIWCMLHNFGGTLGLYGAAERVNQGVHLARKLKNGTMVGTGITPEGINQNYVMYELMLEMGWRDQPANLTIWFENYPVRRYGIDNEFTIKAWQLLLKSVYSFNDTSAKVRGKYIITRRPSLKLSPTIWYDPLDLAKAWDGLVEASNEISSEPFHHDLVDVTRQCLQVLGAYYHSLMVKGYRKSNMSELRENSEMMLGLLEDLEGLLSTNEDFLLGKWLHDARSRGTSKKESDFYEYNARNQITLWGPRGEIVDYANKQWAGVVSHYFKPRWQLFISSLISSLEAGQKDFDQNTFNQQVFANVEVPFTLETNTFLTKPKGDALTVSKIIYKKWRHHFKQGTIKRYFQRKMEKRSARLTLQLST